MSKVSGSYESVVRGVSEQVPQDRRSGQHFEQVNMISDPVRGLARRHGSIVQDEVIIGDYDATSYAAMLRDTLRHRKVSFFVAGVEYDILVRSTSDTEGLGTKGFAWAFRKDTARFIPVVYSTDALLAKLVSGGVSAACNVGRYLYLAGNTIIPTLAATDNWGSASNKLHSAVWVRQGAYSRTFSITTTSASGAKTTYSYKTVSASYPGLLDTSDIPVDSKDGQGNSDYQKRVNDRVNAYNAAVTAWIGTSAADITPENIAQKLAAQIAGATVQGSTVCITNAAIVEVSADDGGDGTLIRAVGQDVSALDLVSTVHWAGKTVRVRPKTSKGDDAFYLRAYPKDVGATGFVQVAWREAAGYEQKPGDVFVMGTVKNGTLYLAGSAQALQGLTGDSNPEFKANAVGDDLTCPKPYFFGKTINYLGVFQDRLVVGAGAVLMFSRPGDYFNFYRQSALTVIDSDPWEGYALGAEDDVIRHSTTYDRNLYLYGERFQYTVSGRQPLTPKTASIVKATAYAYATDASPVGSGNYVFYGKYAGRAGSESSSLHQVQAGVVADTPQSSELSGALDQYLLGRPVQIEAMNSPDTVFLRTTGARNRLYLYTFLDNQSGSERLFDAWSRWEWDESVGSLVGMSAGNSDLTVYMLRQGNTSVGIKVWIAAERFVLDTDLSDYPYADSLRPLSDDSGFLNSSMSASVPAVAAFERTSEFAFVGAARALFPDLVAAYPNNLTEAWMGAAYPAYVTPTNPYMRDTQGKAFVSGRLTLGRVSVQVAQTGGLAGSVTVNGITSERTRFTGRILGQGGNVIGKQPIATTSVSVAVGKEVRECTYTLAAIDWLPLTITAIEWTGQYFFNSRRV